jgi:hypothetical protein
VNKYTLSVLSFCADVCRDAELLDARDARVKVKRLRCDVGERRLKFPFVLC